MNVNKAIIVGNITRDPELKALPGGTNVCSFSIATNEYYTKDGSKVEKTEFHNIVAFGNLAENIAKYMGKGNSIYIEGKLQTRNWDDADSGKKMYRTEIVAMNVQFGSKPSGEGSSKPKASNTNPDSLDNEFPEEDINPEDIPF